MKKVFFVVLLSVLTIIYLLLFYRKNSSAVPSASGEIVQSAKHLFLEKKSQGVDLSKGPCLSNSFVPDWVVDVAHNPRLPVDNLPENQCSAFREGKAHHFVELDMEGNLIRAL